MTFEQTAKFRFAGLFIIILLSWGMGICLSEAQEADRQSSALGELKLEGKHIERLVLRRMDGHIERFDRPAETIKLPVGEYLLDASLKGRYSCRFPSGDSRVTVTKDKPVVLKFGAPLKQTVKAQRRGRILVLNYELLGVGGESYASPDRSTPPTFTIYKGDKEIASDKFEFG
jgi:hypothetical protein